MSSGEPATKKSKTEALPEHLSGIPEETKKVLIEIDAVQNEIDGLNEKASEEILKSIDFILNSVDLDENFFRLFRDTAEMLGQRLGLGFFRRRLSRGHPLEGDGKIRAGRRLAEQLYLTNETPGKKVEQKYNLLRRPQYEKRCEMIKKIPNFWCTAFLNHPQLSSIIDESEEQALAHLSNIEVDEFDDIKSGFRLRFFFTPNEFFENEKIEKEYNLGDTPSTTGTTIRWKEGKNLGKKGDSSSPLSFFEWLSENVDPAHDDIAEVIKDDMWPNPLQYYLLPEMEETGDDFEELIDDEEGLEEVVDDEGGSDGEENDA
ncbi:nucleosome assembly protein [Ancylostoma ceylanicum]|uniref:Nucleosome assembly protein n=1 Tax=Ancylostoma ceylanicum TaxID=53326 RepID=A0A0D6LR86_9BILA|nr:nucleosome assembly protein [Ancylostoma ceylanicum]